MMASQGKSFPSAAAAADRLKQLNMLMNDDDYIDNYFYSTVAKPNRTHDKSHIVLSVVLTLKSVSTCKLDYVIKFLASKGCWKIFGATNNKETSKKEGGQRLVQESRLSRLACPESA